MKMTKCDRCGVEDKDNEGKIAFYILQFKIGFSGFMNVANYEYDICAKCKIALGDEKLKTLTEMISAFIKEMPEEKG